MTYAELQKLVKGRRQGAWVQWTESGLIEHLRWHRSGLLLARPHKGHKEHIITVHADGTPYRCVVVDPKTKLPPFEPNLRAAVRA